MPDCPQRVNFHIRLMKKLAIYNHGKDSRPWTDKTHAMAEVAKRHGYDIESPDYRDQPDPDERVKRLLSMDLSGYDEVVLIGSSMGAYVATVASSIVKPKGLFLMAPAFYLPGYRQTEFNPPAEKTLVIHGWHDEIVPPENSWEFCQLHRIRLKMLNADHRLMSVLPEVALDFDHFLSGLLSEQS